MAKRRNIISLACLLAFLCLFSASIGAAQVTMQELTKYITAYKYEKFSTIPETSLYLEDMSLNNIPQGTTIDVPTSAILSEYPAFAWTLIGNIPNTVTLSFKLYPLVLQNSATEEWLPYSIRFAPAVTLIDQMTVPAGPFYHNGVAYNYAEAKLSDRTANLPRHSTGSTTETAAQTVDLHYTLVTSTSPSINVATVDHWIRNGVAYVKIDDISQEPPSYGTYTATMVVSCTAN